MGINYISPDIQREVDFIFDVLGDTLYSQGLFSDKYSFLAGRYQLPIRPKREALLVGPWLKIGINTDLPKAVFISDLSDDRLLSTLRASLGRNVEYRVSAPLGVPSIWTEDKAVDFDLQEGMEFWYFVEVSMVTLRGIPRMIPFSDLPDVNDLVYDTLPIPLGWSAAGFQYVDLSYMVSALVCGATRTGKSVFLRQLLIFLSNSFSPGEFRAILGDFKYGVEFGRFVDISSDHFSLVSSPSELLDLVDNLVSERFNMFADVGCRSILDFNLSGADPLPYYLVVVDEFAAFRADGGRSAVTRAELSVSRSAGAGVHWIVSTQRPSIDVVTGSLKANLGARISFSLATPTDVEVVFGSEVDFVLQTGCRGRGGALVGDKLFEFQSAFLE